MLGITLCYIMLSGAHIQLLGGMIGRWSTVFLILYVLFSIGISVAIAMDAKRLSERGALFLPLPLLWGIATFILGPIVVPFYWLFHYSSFRK